MSQYYQQVRLLVSSFTLKYLHLCLDKIILSYIIYESADFQGWLRSIALRNPKYKQQFKICKKCKVKVWQVSPHYGTKQYLLKKYTLKIKSSRGIDLSSIKYLFDFWQPSINSFCALVSYSKNLFGLLYIRKEDEYHEQNAEIILAETIEQIYTHHIAVKWQWCIENSKIKIIDSDDYGFSSVKFTFKTPLDSSSLAYKLPHKFVSLVNRVYYFEPYDGIGFIVKLIDGRWFATKPYFYYDYKIHYSLVSAIEETCGIDEFLRYQKYFNLERECKNMKIPRE